MTISAIFFIGSRGNTLISRIFRDDVSAKSAEAFRLHVICAKDVRSPITTLGSSMTFMHIKVEDVYVAVVTRQNTDAAMVFETLHRIVGIFRSHFMGKFNEHAIISNFVLIYEVLDEIYDHGFPQAAGTEAINITQASHNKKDAMAPSKVTSEVTGAIPWRMLGITYKKNEVFIDVVETVNMLVSAKGNLLHADVSGQILMKAFLSGMPECRFGMNDKLTMSKGDMSGRSAPMGRRSVKAGRRKAQAIAFDDCNFHQCVRLGRFETDRSISFVPPDGEFELCKYRITENIALPFRIIPNVQEIGRKRVDAQVSIRALYGPKMVGNSVVVRIPTPPNTAYCKITCSSGKAKYRPTQDAIMWKIRKFPGATEVNLTASIELTASSSSDKKWSRPPIAMQFVVPMFTASGIHIRFLRVVEPKLKYTPIKWVRYLSQSGGNYQIRI